MLSLRGVFDYSSLTKFDLNIKKKLNIEEKKDIEYICEWKIDGLSVAINFKSKSNY